MIEDTIIPEEVPNDDIQVVEELPVDIGLEVVEEPINENDNEDEITVEEDPAEDILLEEDPLAGNELHAAEYDNEQISEIQKDENVNESDPKTNDEEILLNIEKIATSVEVTQANVKTGIENLQLLSTCSFSISLMLLGGFVIYCFLNRLG